MKNRTLLTPAGGAIIAICFFLPWLRISCMGTSSYSGAGFGGIYWAIFAGGLALILGYLLLRRLKRLEYLMSLVAAVSIITVAVIFYGIMTIAAGKRVLFFRVGPEDVNLRFQVGSFGTLLGFILAWIGAFPAGLKSRLRRRPRAATPATAEFPPELPADHRTSA